jgi:hypothetical protein
MIMRPFSKALLYGIAMLALGLSVGNYTEQLQLISKINDLPTVQASAEQRVVNLPEDGKAYYTSLFLAKNWQADPKSRELRAWFDTNITLASLKSQTHFNIVTPADPQWGSKYAQSVGPALPCVAVTDASGTLVYKASAKTLPATSNALAADVFQSVERRRRNRCPINEPTPVTPEPAIPDTTPALPDTSPAITTPPAEEHFPLWLGIILGIAGITAAVAPDVIKKYKAMG